MKLFGEKVEHTFTNSPHNILECKDYNEIFFDVYEIELNNGKYPVEKVSVYGGNPVVMVPIIVEGEEKEYPFILMKGKENIIFNEDNVSVPIDKDVSELFEEDVDMDRLEQTRQEILEQISKAKKDALFHAEQIKRQKIQEARKEITSKKKALDDMVSSARESLVNEFLNISKKIKGEFISENDNRWEEIQETIDNKIEDISSSLSESLRKDFSTSEQQFDSKIRELVKELYKSLQPKIDNDLKDIAKQIVEKVNSIEIGFDKKFQKSINDIRENVTDVALEMNEKVGRVKSEISQKVEKIDKNVNKSLSRVGSLDKKVDKVIHTISEEIDYKLKGTEDQISKSWNDKLKLLEDKNLDINDKNRKYLIDLITESKHGLIEEVRKISKQAPIEYVVEANNTKKNINQDDIVKDLEKKINFLVSDVETRLRKYVAVYGGGGGTVATQYQDGGVMNGDLTIVGTVSAANYLGLPTDMVGSDVTSLSANWQNTYTTVQANSANWVPYTGALSSVNLGTNSLSANTLTLSGQSFAPLGSVSAPSYTFTGDPNTGMWSPAADTLAWSTGGSERMRIDTSGNVGIGTTTPSQKLDVNGNINVPTTTSTVGAYMINGTRFAHNYGTSNTFIGLGAGNFTMTGQANTSLGESSLTNLTSGNFNFGLGRSAGSGISSGSSNVLIGNSAGSSITTTSFNTIIGDAAGFASTGLNGVVYIGRGAGRAINTFTDSVFLGTVAGGTTDGGLQTVSGLTNAIAIGARSYVGASHTMVLGSVGAYATDIVSGGSVASAKLHLIKTTEQLRLGYDASNYMSATVSSAGLVTLDAVGASAGFAFSDPVTATAQPALSAMTDNHVMTRSLVELLFVERNLNIWYWNTQSANVVTGSSAVDLNGGISMFTGSTANSTAHSRATGSAIAPYSSTGSSNAINWSLPMYFSFCGYSSNITSTGINRCYLGLLNSDTAIKDLDSKGVGIKTIGTDIYFQVFGASLITSASPVGTLTANSQEFLISGDGSGTYKLFINGLLVSSLGGGPTGLATSSFKSITLTCSNGANSEIQRFTANNFKVYLGK